MLRRETLRTDILTCWLMHVNSVLKIRLVRPCCCSRGTVGVPRATTSQDGAHGHTDGLTKSLPLGSSPIPIVPRLTKAGIPPASSPSSRLRA